MNARDTQNTAVTASHEDTRTVQLTYAQAAALALSQAMDADPTVVALGEDLGRGGVFGQYRDAAGQPLVQRFGPGRIVDTPISEATIVGAAVGMALAGCKPVVELRVVDFALCAIDEIVNQAAKNRYMFGGQGRVPLVMRMPIGIWSASAAQHSQSLEENCACCRKRAASVAVRGVAGGRGAGDSPGAGGWPGAGASASPPPPQPARPVASSADKPVRVATLGWGGALGGGRWSAGSVAEPCEATSAAGPVAVSGASVSMRSCALAMARKLLWREITEPSLPARIRPQFGGWAARSDARGSYKEFNFVLLRRRPGPPARRAAGHRGRRRSAAGATACRAAR